MLIRLRSRDGVERVDIDPHATVGQLSQQISEELRVPVENQKLSTRQQILLSKTPDQFLDMRDPSVPLSSLGIGHGSVVFMYYDGERSIAGPIWAPAGSFGKKMTMDELIAKQKRIERQEKPHCASLSFDREAANVFQHYVHDSLGFTIQRGGFMYGSVNEAGEVAVDFIYEPDQTGGEDSLSLQPDPDEAKLVEMVAEGLGMRKVGFIFTQTAGNSEARDCTMASNELRQAAELQAEAGFPQFAIAIVKLEADSSGAPNVHFEAFQLSDQCLSLWREGWIVESPPGLDPKLSKLKAQAIVLGKDVTEVDNDFFLVPVKILDHEGQLQTKFPVENRLPPANEAQLRQHLASSRGRPYSQRLADFHLLLFLARFFEGEDVPRLAECVRLQSAVPDGYQLMIDALCS